MPRSPGDTTRERAAAGEPVAVIAWGSGELNSVSYEVPLRYVDLSLVRTMLDDGGELLPPLARARAREIADELWALGVEKL